MMNNNVKKITLAALLTAIAVVGSLFSFPVLGSKCSPVQHMVNIISAILLGPWWGLGCAFAASVIRNLLGLGTLLAFPGSMCGALLAGLMYRAIKSNWAAYAGELFGTGIIGGMLSYPVALLLMGNSAATLFMFVIPFLVSSAGGTIFAVILVTALAKTGALAKMKDSLNG